MLPLLPTKYSFQLILQRIHVWERKLCNVIRRQEGDEASEDLADFCQVSSILIACQGQQTANGHNQTHFLYLFMFTFLLSLFTLSYTLNTLNNSPPTLSRALLTWNLFDLSNSICHKVLFAKANCRQVGDSTDSISLTGPGTDGACACICVCGWRCWWGSDRQWRWVHSVTFRVEPQEHDGQTPR